MEIGKTVTSDKFPNTIDSFWFVLEPDSIINPFDFITVEQAHHTKSIGIVQYSQTIGADTRSASDSYIYNYLIAKSNGLKDQPYSYVEATMARAAVMATAGTKSKTDLSHLMGIVVNMPVGLDRPVRFANSEEIKFALGITEM